MDSDLLGQPLAPFGEVGARLGSGATSAVYAVTAAGAGAALALKVLHAEHAGDLDLVLRFFNEERAAARVQHPGVMRIHGRGLLGERPYLLLERLDGTLAQRAGRLTRAQRLGVLAQVAAAAAALHQAGVIHRDLKPSNIMFDPASGAAKVVDLGLAKLSPSGGDLPVSTAATDVLGTMEYRAPELWISAKDSDDRADVYALGVMLFEVLAGCLPFQAERESRLMEQHLFVDPPAVPSAPAELAVLLRRMLAKRRAQRPDMAEVAAALVRR